MNPRVVESVVTQLQGGLYGKCLRAIVSVSNYTVEVSTQSITEQIFDISLQLFHFRKLRRER